MFSASTPGAGILSPPPITNSTAKGVAHRIIVPKQNITHPFPFILERDVLVAHEEIAANVVFAAQVPTRARQAFR